MFFLLEFLIDDIVPRPLFTLFTELAPPRLNPFMGCSPLETAPFGIGYTPFDAKGAGICPLLLELPPKFMPPLLCVSDAAVGFRRSIDEIGFY